MFSAAVFSELHFPALYIVNIHYWNQNCLLRLTADLHLPGSSIIILKNTGGGYGISEAFDL